MSDVKRFKLKALQLLSTEQGAKAAGEVFEKNATDEEVALGVALGLYEQLRITNDELRIDSTQPLPQEGEENAMPGGVDEEVKPTPGPSQGEGGKAKKGGKKQ